MSDLARRAVQTPTPMPEPTHAGAAPAAADTPARLAQARAGSVDALGELWATCRNYLLLVANSGLGETLQAKIGASDLVQETFCEAQRIFDRFGGSTEAELLAWLVKILENKLGNTVKRYQRTEKRDVGRERRLGVGDASSGLSLQIAGAQDTPGAELARREVQERLDAAIGRLSTEYRQAIQLRVWQELPFEEVGRQMNRSADAARKLVARAIDQLQSLMVTDLDDSTQGTDSSSAAGQGLPRES